MDAWIYLVAAVILLAIVSDDPSAINIDDMPSEDDQ
jgi:hypothetical protein